MRESLGRKQPVFFVFDRLMDPLRVIGKYICAKGMGEHAPPKKCAFTPIMHPEGYMATRPQGWGASGESVIPALHTA